MKKLLIIIFLILHYSGHTQNSSIDDISGVWSVQEIKSLIPGVWNETADEYNERLSSIKSCIGSKVEISKNHIIFNEKKCHFFNCLDLQEQIYSIEIIGDRSNKLTDDDDDYDDIEAHHWIGKASVNLMDTNYSSKKIQCIFTDCPTGDGDNRAKIFLVSKTKIVIFQYYNLIILEK